MPKITELYAWVCADKNEDDEGVPAIDSSHIGFPGVMPLMGADSVRAFSLRRAAKEAANKTGRPVKLIRSTAIEIVEWVKPDA